MRFKFPSDYKKELSWINEFRVTDSPMLDKEKSVLVFLITLFNRIIVDEELGINFYIPMSLVDENFEKAHLYNALKEQKFWFRKYFCSKIHGNKVSKDEYVQISILEFFEGNKEFDGMKKLIEKFIEINKSKINQSSNYYKISIEEQIWKIYDFYVARAKGLLINGPEFARNFVTSHKHYKNDSFISDEIMVDLLDKILDI